MRSTLKDQLKSSFILYGAYLFVRDRFWVWNWTRSGGLPPPPPLVKQRCVVAHQHTFGPEIMIETGTFRGEMVRAVRGVFREIYSIELSEELYRRAVDVFAAFPHINLLRGDSSDMLRTILARIDQPCLFWLDAHYSGAGTGLGDRETPILAELECITRHSCRHHVILIDDARLFDGAHAYPSLAQLTALVHGFRPEWSVTVMDDIIRITPAMGFATGQK